MDALPNESSVKVASRVAVRRQTSRKAPKIPHLSCCGPGLGLLTKSQVRLVLLILLEGSRQVRNTGSQQELLLNGLS